ncbi:MAG: hypothetical protein ABJA37_05910 [Ferruginibacter sp.]
MMINRTNYESYFLLYVDNELPAAERKIVEEFVEKNADLKEEFLQLQQAVLPAEEVIFGDKMNLYKWAAADHPLQEKLLMQLDGELDEEGAAAITVLLATDYKLKAEWEILQQTKLDAGETIVFKEKNLLYRKERDNVVAGRFIRWAVAAAILGAGFFIGITFLNKKGPANNTGKVNTANKNASIAEKIPVLQTTENTINTTKPLPTEKGTAQQQANQGLKINTQKESKENFVNNRGKDKKAVLSTAEKLATEKPLLANNSEQKIIQKQNAEKTNDDLAIVAAKIKPVPTNTLTDINLSLVDNNLAKTAGLTDAGKENNNDRILYMNEETVSRSKAGSFFRKLKRVVERNTNIKTDKGLRLGGFELAIK